MTTNFGGIQKVYPSNLRENILNKTLTNSTLTLPRGELMLETLDWKIERELSPLPRRYRQANYDATRCNWMHGIMLCTRNTFELQTAANARVPTVLKEAYRKSRMDMGRVLGALEMTCWRYRDWQRFEIDGKRVPGNLIKHAPARRPGQTSAPNTFQLLRSIVLCVHGSQISSEENSPKARISDRKGKSGLRSTTQEFNLVPCWKFRKLLSRHACPSGNGEMITALTGRMTEMLCNSSKMVDTFQVTNLQIFAEWGEGLDQQDGNKYHE